MKVNIPYKGVHTDNHPVNQPEHTTRYALNVVGHSNTGNLYNTVNEEGFATCLGFPTGYKPVGSVYIGKDNIIVFLQGETSSEIGKINNCCEYTSIYNNPCLNFKSCNPIDATYRRIRGCEDIIYFTDGLNPPRVINLSKTYNECDEFNMFKEFKPACIKDIKTLAGGNLDIGSYIFAIRYLDDNENPTNWFYSTPSQAVTNAGEGAYTIETDPIFGVPNASQSITFTIADVDLRFRYYQIAVIAYVSGIAVNNEVLVSPLQPIEQKEFTYDGDKSNYTLTVLDDITFEKADIKTALHIEQLEDRLLLANTTGTQIDWCRFQTYASKIETGYITKQFPIVKNQAVVPYLNEGTHVKGYMRDEVYSFSVVWSIGGVLSPSFHIPGIEYNITQTPFTHKEDSSIQLNDNPNYHSNGKLQQYEISIPYSNKLDCQGEPMFPIGNIRHHKFPSNIKEPHFDKENVYIMGVTFNNINPPPEYANLVDGYYIYRGDRNAGNSTILSKGFMSNTHIEEIEQTGLDKEGETWEIVHLTTAAVANSNIAGFKMGNYNPILSPEILVHQLNPNNKILKGYLDFKLTKQGIENTMEVENLYTNIHHTDMSNDGLFISPLSFETIVSEQYELYNPTGHLLYYGKRTIPSPVVSYITHPQYIGIFNDITPYKVLDNIQYLKASTCIENNTSIDVFGGDIYVSIFKYEFFRDTIISSANQILRDILLIPIESTVNSELLFYDNNECPDGFEKDEEGLFIVCVKNWLENKDFSIQNKVHTYFGLSSNYECCSDCQEKNPNRIWFSDKSFSEEMIDYYRSFKPNNYDDIQSEFGEITNLFKYYNNLYIHCVEGLFRKPQNIQERNTSELVTYLGTGEFLALPENKLLDSDVGSAGCQHKQATIKTPYGIFFVDELERKVWLFRQDKLEELSSEKYGNSKWFKNNISIKLTEFIKEYKCIDNKIGFISTYNSEDKIVILTKKDYLPKKHWGGIIYDKYYPRLDNKLYYDAVNNNFIFLNVELSQVETIEVGDTKHFNDYSWTFSFSLILNAWNSWHSYIPNYYIRGKENTYSGIDHILYKHNSKSVFQTYYGIKYPHTIELVFISETTNIWDNIGFYCESISAKVDSDIIFNKAWFYNSKQHSGEIELLLKNVEDEDSMMQSINELPDNQAWIIKKERDWYLNDMRDNIVNYQQQMFIDNPIDRRYTNKLLNTAIIDFEKIWNEQSHFRDKYLIVRLIFDNFNNVQLTTKVSLLNEYISNR